MYTPWECCGKFVCTCGKAKHPPHIQWAISECARNPISEHEEMLMTPVAPMSVEEADRALRSAFERRAT